MKIIESLIGLMVRILELGVRAAIQILVLLLTTIIKGLAALANGLWEAARQRKRSLPRAKPNSHHGGKQWKRK